MDTLHEDVCTIVIICSSVLLRMRNFSERNCRENPNKHFMFKLSVVCGRVDDVRRDMDFDPYHQEVQ